MKSVAFAVGLVLTSSSFAGEWPGFRGPHVDGIAEEAAFPLKWGPKENIAWKIKLPGPGSSSPVIWGEHVFITCFTGKKAEEIVRHVLCFDRKTGSERWHKKYPAPQPENDYAKQLLQHGFATHTPVTDGKLLYVYLGRGGLHALDFEGKEVWTKELGDSVSVFGSGASPVLLGDTILVNAYDECYKLVALDKAAGKVLWKSTVPGFCWSTPVVATLPGGKKEIVLNVGGALVGYDAADGKQLWNAEIAAGYNSSTPLIRDGVVYVMNQSMGDKEFVAVRAGGRGNVTKTHVVWRQDKAGASYCSPLLKGKLLFYFSGQATALNVSDGAIVKQESLDGLKNLYGSPILAGDRIILFTRSDGAYVLSADDKLNVLAHNDLGDESNFNGSPALVAGNLFVRSNQFLYCIGKK